MTTTCETVTCHDCGACCLHVGAVWPLLTDTLDHRPLPERLHTELLERKGTPGWDYDAPCSWLDRTTNRCRHYDHRPSVCREFEVGGEDCLRIRQEWAIDDGPDPLPRILQQLARAESETT